MRQHAYAVLARTDNSLHLEIPARLTAATASSKIPTASLGGTSPHGKI